MRRFHVLGRQRKFYFCPQYIALTALVGFLLFARRPATVSWLVIAVRVYAIKGAPGWPFTHIRNKVLKRVPSLAHRDASSAIPNVINVFGIVAALAHVLPTEIGRSALPRMAMFHFHGAARASNQLLSATTAHRSTRAQVVAYHRHKPRAIAQAQPNNFA